jgi:hypothetical protein
MVVEVEVDPEVVGSARKALLATHRFLHQPQGQEKEAVAADRVEDPEVAVEEESEREQTATRVSRQKQMDFRKTQKMKARVTRTETAQT